MPPQMSTHQPATGKLELEAPQAEVRGPQPPVQEWEMEQPVPGSPQICVSRTAYSGVSALGYTVTESPWN